MFILPSCEYQAEHRQSFSADV